MTEEQKRGIQEALLADENWRGMVYDSLRYLIEEQLLKEFLGYFDEVISSVRFWVKAPCDVQEIMARVAEDYHQRWCLDILEVMDVYGGYIWEAVANCVNEGSCRIMSAQGFLGESMMPLKMPVWPGKREDYNALIAHVRFWWDQMRHPDSIFESASSCHVDLVGQIESMGRDPAEIFAEYTEPFFGRELGHLLYHWGEELDRLTTRLRRGRKKERIQQTEELAAVLVSKKAEFAEAVKGTLTEGTLFAIVDGLLN